MKSLINLLLSHILLGLFFGQLAFAQEKKDTKTDQVQIADIKKNQDDTSNTSENTAMRPILTVTVTNPSFKKVQRNLRANGTIEAREIAYVTAQTSGLSLNRLHVDAGDHIKKGQVLAEYDATTAYNDIAQAQAGLMEAQVALKQATSNAKRARRLAKTTAMSKIEHDNYLSQEQMATAKVAAAKAMLNNQSLRANYAKVKSKINGRILDKQAVLGEVGNPGTKLFSVIVNNQLEWQAQVPSKLLGLVRPNMPVQVTLIESGASVDSDINAKVQGIVRRIDPTVDRQTRQGKVYVTMRANPKLRRGLFLQGEFLMKQVDVLVVPISCLIRKDGYNYVFIVGADDHVIRKKVAIGKIDGKNMTILSGLTSNDLIVTTGVGFLNSGDLVKVVEE